MTWLALGAFLQAVAAAWASAAAGQMSLGWLLVARGLAWLAVLLPWAAFHRREATGRNRRWLALGSLSATVFVALYSLALLQVPLALATTIVCGTTPLWVLLLSRRRPPAVVLVGLAAAGGGLILILLPQGSFDLASLAGWGGPAAFLGAAACSVTFLSWGRLGGTDPPWTVNLWYAVVSTAASLPLALLQPPPATAWPWLCGALYGLFGVLGQGLLVLGTMRAGPTAGSTAGALLPVFAAGLGWAAFSQPVSGAEALGIALACGGAALVGSGEHRAGHS